MHFVIVSKLFWPLQNPESYCATRFASALAHAGHTVHVITDERPDSEFGGAMDKLMEPSVMVTRITPVVRESKYPHLNLRWLTVWDNDVYSLPAYIRATKAVLEQYEKPILVTRTYPWLSLYVGWHCRKFAAKWVAHFSDPMLEASYDTGLGRLQLRCWKVWMRRAMRHADAISVTCKRVRWYYREQLGPCVDKTKFILTTHIGDFKLDGGKKELGVRSQELEQEDGEKKGLGVRSLELAELGAGKVGERRIDDRPLTPNSKPLTPHLIYHDGDIYAGRGLLMVEAVDKLNAEGFPCLFLQGRDVTGEDDRRRLLASPHCKIVGKNASVELKSLAKSAQVSFVADFDTPGLNYSPFLMSKFVYQLFTGKPIVVLSKHESEKHDYCVAYPEAGLFYAEVGNAYSLAAAIQAAFASDSAQIERTRIREVFSEDLIARHFVDSVEGREIWSSPTHALSDK